MKKRKKDLASAQQQFCYTGEELLEYLTKSLLPARRSAIFNHLNVEKCADCRTTYRSLRDIPDSVMEKTDLSGYVQMMIEKLSKTKRKKIPDYPSPIRLQKGQMWTTLPEIRDVHGKKIGMVDTGMPVLILSPGNGTKRFDNIIRVIPISYDTEFSLKGESLILERESPLEFPVLLKVFDERPMLAGILGKYLGAIDSERIKEVISVRLRFLSGETSKPDPEYLEWKQGEIRLTQYLTAPVNQWLREDLEGVGKKEKESLLEKKIVLEPYRKAADVTNIELSEVKTHVLMKKDDFLLAVLQIRDQLILRFCSDKIEPQDLLIDGKPAVLDQKGFGNFESVMGQVYAIPETIRIEVTLQKTRMAFDLQFRSKDVL